MSFNLPLKKWSKASAMKGSCMDSRWLAGLCTSWRNTLFAWSVSAGLSIFFGLNSCVIHGQGWLSPWLQRIPVYIQADSPEADLEVLIVLATDSFVAQGVLQPGCEDLRITSSDGITLLPFWIESGCGTSVTRIWVRIDTLKGMGQVDTFYIYLENPGAVSVSDPFATFHFYDPFDSLLSVWQLLEPPFVAFSGGQLVMTGDGYPMWEKIKTVQRVMVKGFITESFEIIQAGGNTYHWMYFGTYPYQSTNDATLCDGGLCGGDNIGWGSGCGWGDFQIYLGDASLHFCNGNPITSGMPYLKRFTFGYNNQVTLEAEDTSGNVLATVNTTSWTIPDSAYMMYLCAYNGQCIVDWVRIRRLPRGNVVQVGFGPAEFACVMYPAPDTAVVVVPGGLTVANPLASGMYVWYDCLTGEPVDTGTAFYPAYSGWFYFVGGDSAVFPRCTDSSACYSVCVNSLSPQLIAQESDSLLMAFVTLPPWEPLVYYWQDCDSLTILDTTLWNWWQPPYEGRFRVIVSAFQGACWDTSACREIRWTPVVTGTVTNPPSDSRFSVVWTSSRLVVLTEPSVREILVYSMEGQILYRKTVDGMSGVRGSSSDSGRRIEIAVGSLPAGTYLVVGHFADGTRLHQTVVVPEHDEGQLGGRRYR